MGAMCQKTVAGDVPVCLVARQCQGGGRNCTERAQTGVTVGYGACKASPILAQSITFATNGGSSDCCSYPVVGIPTSGQIEVVDCAFNLIYGTGNVAIIKACASCMCKGVSVEPATWGRIKSIYRSE